MSAAQQAAALHVLAGVLDEVWVDAAIPRPALLGPDTHSLHDGNKKNNAPTLAYLQVWDRTGLPAGRGWPSSPRPLLPQEYVKDTVGILSAGEGPLRLPPVFGLALTPPSAQ